MKNADTCKTGGCFMKQAYSIIIQSFASPLKLFNCGTAVHTNSVIGDKRHSSLLLMFFVFVSFHAPGKRRFQLPKTELVLRRCRPCGERVRTFVLVQCGQEKVVLCYDNPFW